jgi:hypothetical protein
MKLALEPNDVRVEVEKGEAKVEESEVVGVAVGNLI